MAVSSVRLWLRAARFYAVSASVIPVTVGALYARAEGGALEFFAWRLALALLGGVLIHTAANLWNDYFDFRDGVDREGGGVGSGVLVEGVMTPEQMYRGAVVLASASAAVGVGLAVWAGWRLILLIAAGVAGALFYSAGARSPKRLALGEAWVFLMMGLGMTLGGYMAQTGRFSWGALAAGVPPGLLVVLLLYVNNLRDLETDREAGLRTLPMLLSAKEGKALAGVMVALAYGFTTLMVATRFLPVGALLALASLFWATQWFGRLWAGRVRDEAVMGAAQLHLIFGVLYIAGFAWSVWGGAGVWP